MKSVKGLTWGTPEFIEIAKAAERDGESKHEATKLLDGLESIEFTDRTWTDARAYAATIFELCDGECGW